MYCKAFSRQNHWRNGTPLYYFFMPPGGWLPPGALGFRETLEVAGKNDIPVIVDAAAQVPPGCKFSNRCPFCENRCRTEEPPLLEIGGLSVPKGTTCDAGSFVGT
ncbi:MAG: hypothetical protein LBS00_07750 [Synergistaceae bacterium]|nr:hypothetical protein [Synergistaceae bacterium]